MYFLIFIELLPVYLCTFLFIELLPSYVLFFFYRATGYVLSYYIAARFSALPSYVLSYFYRATSYVLSYCFIEILPSYVLSYYIAARCALPSYVLSYLYSCAPRFRARGTGRGDLVLFSPQLLQLRSAPRPSCL